MIKNNTKISPTWESTPHDHRYQVVSQVVSGFKTMQEQTGKHRALDKLARMTDLNNGDLRTAVSRLGSVERNSIIKAAAEVERVIHAIGMSDFTRAAAI